MRKIGLAVVAATAALWTGVPAFAQDASDAITIVLPEPPPSIDPCDTTSSWTGRVVKNNIAEGLTEFDLATAEVKPRLAESWERKDDDTWVFKLRQGVKFHDGAPFDAAAVKASIERSLTPELACRVRAKYFNNLKLSVEAVDPATVEITSEPPSPILPLMVSHLMLVSPNATAAEKAREPAGTGPFKYVSWDPDQSVVLERNADYWGEKPEVGKATFVWRGDSAVIAAMVETGEADFAPAISNQDATNTETDYAFPNYETLRVRIGMSTPPLNDLRVRKAMNMAVDRDAFIGTILGKDVIKASQLVYPSVIGYNKDLKPWDYDLEGAKKLIEEARADGAPIGTEMRLLTRPGFFPNSTETLEALTQMWGQIGLNVKIMSIDNAQKSKLDSRPFAPDRPPTLSADQHDNASGDASLTMPYKYSNTGSQSDVEGYPELEKLIDAGAQASGEERQRIYAEAFKMLQQEIVPDVVLFHMVGYAREGKRVTFPREIMNASELQIAKFSFKK